MPSGVSQPLGEPSKPLLLLRMKAATGSSSPPSELPPAIKIKTCVGGKHHGCCSVSILTSEEHLHESRQKPDAISWSTRTGRVCAAATQDRGAARGARHAVRIAHAAGRILQAGGAAILLVRALQLRRHAQRRCCAAARMRMHLLASCSRLSSAHEKINMLMAISCDCIAH
jgi:hypothetical protein